MKTISAVCAVLGLISTSACTGPADVNIRLGQITQRSTTTGVFPSGIVIPGGERSTLAIQNGKGMSPDATRADQPHCVLSIYSNTVNADFKTRVMNQDSKLPTKYGFDGIAGVVLVKTANAFKFDLNRSLNGTITVTKSTLLCTRGNRAPNFAETADMKIGELNSIFGFVYHAGCGLGCI